MLARSVRDVIYELRDRVGSLEFRPLESSQTGEEIPAKADAGETARERSARSGVQTVGRGRRVEIARQSGLIETVVASTEFVQQMGVRRVDPVSSDDLGAGVNLREPFLLVLRKVLDGPGIISEEVGPANAAAVVDSEIQLPHDIVDMNDVIESVRDADPLRVFQRESGAVARAGGIAARDLQTRGTDSEATIVGRQLKIGQCIGNAVDAVTRKPERAVSRVRSSHVHHRRTRDSAKRVAHVVALPFISGEEERLVLDERAAQAAAKLLQRSLQLRARGCVEEVPGVQVVTVAPEAKRCAMDIVGARLQADVHDRTRLPSILGRRILLEIELLNRVDREDGCGVSRNARAVDDRLARVRL